MKNIATTATRYNDDGIETADIRVTGARRPQSTNLVYHPEHIEGHGFAARDGNLDQWVLFATQHATVIDNFGGSAAERARMTVEIEIGEPFTIDGVDGTWMLVERDQRRLEGDGVKPVPYDGRIADRAREILATYPDRSISGSHHQARREINGF